MVGMLLVCYRFEFGNVGLLSVFNRCHVGYLSVSNRSIPILTQNDPDMNPTGFAVPSATLSVADSWPFH